MNLAKIPLVQPLPLLLVSFRVVSGGVFFCSSAPVSELHASTADVDVVKNTHSAGGGNIPWNTAPPMFYTRFSILHHFTGGKNYATVEYMRYFG